MRIDSKRISIPVVVFLLLGALALAEEAEAPLVCDEIEILRRVCDPTLILDDSPDLTAGGRMTLPEMEEDFRRRRRGRDSLVMVSDRDFKRYEEVSAGAVRLFRDKVAPTIPTSEVRDRFLKLLTYARTPNWIRYQSQFDDLRKETNEAAGLAPGHSAPLIRGLANLQEWILSGGRFSSVTDFVENQANCYATGIDAFCTPAIIAQPNISKAYFTDAIAQTMMLGLLRGVVRGRGDYDLDDLLGEDAFECFASRYLEPTANEPGTDGVEHFKELLANWLGSLAMNAWFAQYRSKTTNDRLKLVQNMFAESCSSVAVGRKYRWETTENGSVAGATHILQYALAPEILSAMGCTGPPRIEQEIYPGCDLTGEIPPARYGKPSE